MEYDNPAARLLALLQKCKQQSPGTSCKLAWEAVLEVRGNEPLLMSRLGKAMELPQTAIDALKESFPNRQENWKHWRAQVSAGFLNQNLSANWATFVNHIDDHTINYLQLSADLLASKATTKILERGQLDELKKQMVDLYNEILDSTINVDVKKYLIRAIRRLIISIDEYQLTGALPILEAVETMVGHAHIDTEYRNFLKTTDLGSKLLLTLGTMADAITVAVGIPQLTSTIQLLAN
jgi:hypothetical protein